MRNYDTCGSAPRRPDRTNHSASPDRIRCEMDPSRWRKPARCGGYFPIHRRGRSRGMACRDRTRRCRTGSGKGSRDTVAGRTAGGRHPPPQHPHATGFLQRCGEPEATTRQLRQRVSRGLFRDWPNTLPRRQVLNVVPSSGRSRVPRSRTGDGRVFHTAARCPAPCLALRLVRSIGRGCRRTKSDGACPAR